MTILTSLITQSNVERPACLERGVSMSKEKIKKAVGIQHSPQVSILLKAGEQSKEVMLSPQPSNFSHLL